jgi:hypothetical protein
MIYVLIMFSYSPLRFGVALLLFAIPYLCDVLSSDELADNLFAQQVTVLETDLDDDKAMGAVPSIALIVAPNAPSTPRGCLVVTYPSLHHISRTILVVSGSRPPPALL